MDNYTVCRVEETKRLKNKSVIEAINEIFNTNEKMEKQITRQDDKLFKIHNIYDYCTHTSIKE